MAKKRILRLPVETEYRIIGVVCSERDYRFCWLINKQLGFNFRRVTDFEHKPLKSPFVLKFSAYHYEAHESLQCSFFLVNNRSENDLKLFGTPAGIDFLLLVKADEMRFGFQELINKLRSVQQLSTAWQLDDALGKNKESFLYDFEMFVFKEIEGVKKKKEMIWATTNNDLIVRDDRQNPSEAGSDGHHN